jgi:hypothetical protein
MLVSEALFLTAEVASSLWNHIPNLARRIGAPRSRIQMWTAGQDPPPRRFIAGADAIATTEQKLADLKSQIDANRALSTSLAFDNEQM